MLLSTPHADVRSTLDAALWTAADYGPIVPLHPETRRPLVSFDAASANPETIARWWAATPDAGIGLASWSSCVIAIDVEHVNKGGADGFLTLDALRATIGDLPLTRTHRTKSGGLHYLFRLTRSVTLRSAQSLIRSTRTAAPGVDVVAGRAVLRWPPTAGYTIESDAEIAPLPAPWIEALGEAPRPVRSLVPTIIDDDRDRRYALAALENEAVGIAELGAGRNVALNEAAFALGQLSPPLRTGEIENALVRACEINGAWREHGERQCLATITRGVRAGMEHPRHRRAA